MNIEIWEKTRLWTESNEDLKAFLSGECGFIDDEISILHFYQNQENWTVFSTKAIYYSNLGKFGKVDVGDMQRYNIDVRAFKTEGKTSMLEVISKSGEEHKFLYETGKPSMGAIYATQTLIQIAY